MRMLGIALWALLCTIPHTASADQVVSQYPIAAIEAGLDPVNKKPAYEMVVAGLVLPEPGVAASPVALNGFQNCTRSALGVWGSRGTGALDGPTGNKPFELDVIPRVDSVLMDLARQRAAQKSSEALTAAVVTEETGRRIGLIDAWLREQVKEVRSNLQKYCGNSLVPEPVRNQARLTLSLRRCPLPAPKDMYHPCNMRGLEGDGKIRLREYGYSQIYAWTQSQGARPHDEWWDIGAGKPGEVVPIDVSGAIGQAAWPAVDESTRLLQFEALVTELRTRKANTRTQLPRSLPSSLPMAIGLTQETAARVLDILESPMYATSTLKSGIQALVSISDEVARSRIKECVNLRRVDIRDSAAIKACSGYDFPESEMAKCLVDERCLPALGSEAIASVLQITSSFDMEELAANTRFPRISDVSFDVWELAAKQCATDSGKQPGTEKQFQILATQCTLGKVLGTDSQATLNCVNSANKNDPSALAKCITGDSAALQCYQQNRSDVSAMAWCSVKSEIPPAVLGCIEGYQAGSARDALRSCATGVLGGDAQKVAMLLDCADGNANDHMGAVLCMAGTQVPAELQGAAECARTNSQSLESFASCAALKQVSLGLDGDLGRLAACGVQAQGDPLGTGVCMAGSDLNPSQQILLQCAASSGGEPWTFAGCTGGRLALQEFAQCKNVNFAEGNCFGKNNEIRRFVRALGLPDIGPNSVVGQIANVNLKILKYQVRFAEDAFEAAGEAVEDVGEALESIGKCIEDFGKSVEGAVKNVGGALEDGFRKVRDLF